MLKFLICALLLTRITIGATKNVRRELKEQHEDNKKELEERANPDEEEDEDEEEELEERDEDEDEEEEEELEERDEDEDEDEEEEPRRRRGGGGGSRSALLGMCSILTYVRVLLVFKMFTR